MTDIVVPSEFWGDALEGVISVWLFADGEAVSAGVTVAELMQEKTSFSLEAPQSGRLRILVGAEVAVRAGQVVGKIDHL